MKEIQYMISFQERWIQNVQPSEWGPSYFGITFGPSYQFFNVACDSFFRHFHLYRWTVFSQSRMFNILRNWSNGMSSSNSGVPLFTPKILWNLHSERITVVTQCYTRRVFHSISRAIFSLINRIIKENKRTYLISNNKQQVPIHINRKFCKGSRS